MTPSMPVPNNPITVHCHGRVVIAHGVVHEIVDAGIGWTVLDLIDLDAGCEEAVRRTFVVSAYAIHEGRWHAFAAAITAPEGAEP